VYWSKDINDDRSNLHRRPGAFNNRKEKYAGIDVPHPAHRNKKGTTFKVKTGKHTVLAREIKAIQSPHKAHIVPIIIIIMLVVSRRLIPSLQLRRNTKRHNDPHRFSFLQFSELHTGRHYTIRRWHVID
jgi:hypothetical protein